MSANLPVIMMQAEYGKRRHESAYHMKRTRALVRTRLDKLYYGEERMLHGAILAEIRKTMSVGKFMDAVNRAKINCVMLNKNSPQ